MAQHAESANQVAAQSAAGVQPFMLPPRLRLLWIGPEEPGWAALALQLDTEGCQEPHLRWVSTGNESLALLREESFDCLVLQDTEDADVLSLLRSIRTGGCPDPILILIPDVDEELTIAAEAWQGEVLATPLAWHSRLIVRSLRRALERIQLEREVHRLSVADHRRLLRERDEADHLLDQQRLILNGLEKLSLSAERDIPLAEIADDDTARAGGAESGMSLERSLPLEFDEYYQELLRAYVMMGSGNLGDEISKLAELLALAGYSPRQALELHLRRVELLVEGLGNRSTRHVMGRADLLALELMIHLGESYQRRSLRPADDSGQME